MIPGLQQWDVVKVRINPNDRDEHPAIVVSPPEICGNLKKPRINVLYGTTRRPNMTIDPFEVQLNGAEGLDHATLFNCAHFYQVTRDTISARLGRVSAERRRQIGRKIVATFRLPL